MSEENIKYEYQGIGLGKSEKYVGKKKFDEYCAIYHITAYSDLQLLEELIYREIMQENFKVQIEEKKKKTETENKTLSEKDQKDVVIATYMVDAMNQNLEQIFSLKEKLGLINNQEGDDGFKYLQQLEDKFKKWCQENQDRSFACPHCSKMVLLYMKQEYWETMKHPFFESKVLGNKKLWELYKEKILTKKQVAEVLGCSEKHIDWLEQKIYLKRSSPSE
jgi:bacterioferritin (cytochrome b1)